MRLLWLLLIGCMAVIPAKMASAQISDGVVRLGVLNDRSGIYSDFAGAGSVVAAQMAVKDFGGTVLGAPIEVISGDHQNKADIGANIAREWVDRQHVDVILDVPNSAVALAVQEITRQANKIHLNTGAASSELTNSRCSPTGIQWTFDTYALAAGTAKALLQQGGDSWYYITADYAFGNALEADATKFIHQGGGKVLGSSRFPLGTSDFSSFLLSAQESKAKVIALVNAGADFTNSLKQAHEFGLTEGGQRLAAMLVHFTDIEALGLEIAAGLVLTESFYWDMNDETRAWTKRFIALNGGKPPTMIHAATYAATLHYLEAVKQAGTDEAGAVIKKMRELPINDFYTKGGWLREDGRVMRPFYLMQVKRPAESKYKFDYYKVLATIPAEEAARPLAESQCPLIKK